MNTIAVVLIILNSIAITLTILMKKNIIKDSNNNNIPDNLENIYKTVDDRVSQIKQEYQDIRKAIEELKTELKELQQAAASKKKLKDKKLKK